MAGQIALNKPSGGQLILSPEDGTSTETLSLTPTGFPKQSGEVVQVVTKRSDAITYYSGANEFVLSPLNIDITPKYADSILLCEFTFTGEGNHDQVFKAVRDGAVITDTGYEGFNSTVGNQRWSGIAPACYDVDMDTTPNNYNLRYFDLARNTNSRTYSLSIRTASSTNKTFAFNRSNASAGTDNQEIGVAFITVTEVAA